jgi:negative regulator of flagellin synthesis FlgM
MKISNIANAYGIYCSQKPAISRKKTTTGGTKDNIDVSDKAKDFQLIMKTLKNSSDIREDKTAELQKKIEDGSYNVSSDDVATKMLSDWLA